MNEKELTAVEWLFLMMNNPNRDQDFANKLLLKAKEIEKQQKVEFALKSYNEKLSTGRDFVDIVNIKSNWFEL